MNSQNSQGSSVQTDITNDDRSGSIETSPSFVEILHDPNVVEGLIAFKNQVSSDGSIDLSRIRNMKTEEVAMESHLSTLKCRRILNKDKLRDLLCSPSSKKKGDCIDS